jgi:hypothetical protein
MWMLPAGNQTILLLSTVLWHQRMRKYFVLQGEIYLYGRSTIWRSGKQCLEYAIKLQENVKNRL